MDIDTIETFLNKYVVVKEQDPAASAEELWPYVTCQLLLHIYRKLEDIDERLIAQLSNEWEDYKRNR